MLGTLLPKALRPAYFRVEERFPALAARRLFKPFPQIFQVQTTSYCNADCVICPYPDTAQEIDMGQMKDDLFRKIVDECAAHDVRVFEPFLMNEPLMDRKFPERLDYIRAKMPDVVIQVDTNLALLTEEAAKSLLRNVDRLLISAHGINAEDFEAVMPKVRFATFMQNVEMLTSLPRTRTHLRVNCVNVRGGDPAAIEAFWAKRGLDVGISAYVDRAGNVREEATVRAGRHGIERAHARGAGKPVLNGCWNADIPLMKMNIVHNGDVILCCMDWRRAEVLGNVREQTLEEIWHSPAYWRVRDALYAGGPIHDTFLCFQCKNPDPGGRHTKFW